MPTKAIIFDFDGVIADSERYWEPAENPWFKSLIPNWKEENHAKLPGMTLVDTYYYLKKNYGLSITIETFLADYQKIGDSVYAQAPMIKGIDIFMTGLKNKNIPMCIASASNIKWIADFLTRHQLTDFIDSITSADEVEAGQGKPEPTLFLLAAKKMKQPPSSCVVIEDANNGVIAAKRAGMACIGFTGGSTTGQDLSQADLIINDFTEIEIEQIISLA